MLATTHPPNGRNRSESESLEIMVERRQEGMTAPIPETKFRVLETTLAELGVDTSHDNLNLAGRKFKLGVKKIGEGTIFIGRLNHPVAREHFVQILNLVSPFKDQDRIDIIDDIDLPIRAQADYKKGLDRFTSENIRLHEKHLNDPRVRDPYLRFAEEHVDRWLEALGDRLPTQTDQVFRLLERLKFITNLETFTNDHFSRVEKELP